KPGHNTLRIEAVNGGGVEQKTVEVSYIEKPVRVEIVGLELRQAQPGSAITRGTELRDGEVIFNRLEDGLVRLHGRVILQKAADRTANTDLEVRSWVNGFRQRSTGLKKSAQHANECSFQIDLVINSAEDNHIVINVPALKVQAESLKRCRVQHCNHPVT